MIVSDVIASARRQIGDDFESRFSDADFYRWINAAQREISLSNNLLQKIAYVPLVGGQSQYTLSTIASDIRLLHSVTYNSVPILGMGLKEFLDNTRDADSTVTGGPVSFTVFAGKLWLFPYPPTGVDDQEIQLFYTRVPTDVDAGADSLDLPLDYHNRVLEYCLAHANEMDEDREGYALKMQEFTVGVQNTQDETDWVNRDAYPTISVDPDSYDFNYMGVYW